MVNLKSLKGLVCLSLVLVGCCRGVDEEGVRNQVNLCATKGGSYLSKLVERPHGTCGKVHDFLVNIDDPAITASVCASVTQANCVERGTACKSYESGCETTATYITKFEADGSSASGTETRSIKCSTGAFCSSTYDYISTRQ